MNLKKKKKLGDSYVKDLTYKKKFHNLIYNEYT